MTVPFQLFQYPLPVHDGGLEDLNRFLAGQRVAMVNHRVVNLFPGKCSCSGGKPKDPREDKSAAPRAFLSQARKARFAGNGDPLPRSGTPRAWLKTDRMQELILVRTLLNETPRKPPPGPDIQAEHDPKNGSGGAALDGKGPSDA